MVCQPTVYWDWDAAWGPAIEQPHAKHRVPAYSLLGLGCRGGPGDRAAPCQAPWPSLHFASMTMSPVPQAPTYLPTLPGKTGDPVKRGEDPRLLMGAGAYLAD